MTEFLASKNQQRAPWLVALTAGSILLAGCSGANRNNEDVCYDLHVGQATKNPMIVDVLAYTTGDQIRGATYNFGDGASETVVFSDEYGLVTTHGYKQAGQFTVSATVAYGPDSRIRTSECPDEVVTVPYTG
jgi:hypothetical protein